MTDQKPKPESSRSGSENRRRTATLPRVRCTEAQRTAVEAEANRAGLSLSSYMLAAVMKGEPPRAARVPPLEQQVMLQLSGRLGRLNGNVYQIVRSINFKDFPDLYALKDLAEEVEELRDALRLAMGKRPAEEPAVPETPLYKTPEEARTEFATLLRGFGNDH